MGHDLSQSGCGQGLQGFRPQKLPTSSFLLPELTPGSQTPGHPSLRPQGHSLGPGLAGLVIAPGEMSWWARAQSATESAGSATPGVPRDSFPRVSESPSPCAQAPMGPDLGDPHPILVDLLGRGIQLGAGVGALGGAVTA